MNKEGKSAIKIGAIALVIMAVVMFGIYKYQQSRSGGHHHGDGAVHSH